MSYPRIVHAVFNAPWAIQRPWLGTIFSLLHSRVFGAGGSIEAPAFEVSDSLADAIAAGQGRQRRGLVASTRYGKDARGRLVNHSARIHAEALKRCGNSASAYYTIVREEEAALGPDQILHVFGSGIMGKHLSSFEEMCAGGLSVDRIQAELRAARDDDKVAAIMMHLDTPGGISYGCAETAALVRQVGGAKTIAAFCDSLTASAGYWATCAADAYYITPSADVGSIGVYCAVVDYTAWCEKEGIKVDLIKDGTYKGAGFPGTAMTPEQRALIESEVMDCSAMFKGDVRAARDVSEETMQGQTIGGKKAIDAGLADTLVNGLEEALQDLATTI